MQVGTAARQGVVLTLLGSSERGQSIGPRATTFTMGSVHQIMAHRWQDLEEWPQQKWQEISLPSAAGPELYTRSHSNPHLQPHQAAKKAMHCAHQPMPRELNCMWMSMA